MDYQKLVDRTKTWFENNGVYYEVTNWPFPGTYKPLTCRVIFDHKLFDNEAKAALVHIHELVHVMFHYQDIMDIGVSNITDDISRYSELMYKLELEAEFLSFQILLHFGLYDRDEIGHTLPERLAMYSGYWKEEDGDLDHYLYNALQPKLERLLNEVYW